MSRTMFIHGIIKGVEANEEKRAPKPFLGVMFECCGVYDRVYREKNTQEYQGRCPKCLRKFKVQVDEQRGTATKFIKVM